MVVGSGVGRRPVSDAREPSSGLSESDRVYRPGGLHMQGFYFLDGFFYDMDDCNTAPTVNR